MSTYRIEDSTLTAIGDAIRTKRDSDALIAPEDMAAAILGIETGGGSSNVVEGSFTIESDIGIPTQGYKLPFKLDRMPDILLVWLSRDSFLGKTGLSNNRLYRICAYKQSTIPPLLATTNVITDSRVGADGYVFDVISTQVSNTSSPNGSALSGNVNAVNTATYTNWRFKDGELQIAKITSAGAYLLSGIYRYVAFYGADYFIY